MQLTLTIILPQQTLLSLIKQTPLINKTHIMMTNNMYFDHIPSASGANELKGYGYF